MSETVYFVTMGRTIGIAYPRMVSNPNSKHKYFLFQTKLKGRDYIKKVAGKEETRISFYFLLILALFYSAVLMHTASSSLSPFPLLA